MANTANPVARSSCLFWSTPQTQWDALIYCYGQHYRPSFLALKDAAIQKLEGQDEMARGNISVPVGRSNLLLWPTPQASRAL